MTIRLLKPNKDALAVQQMFLNTVGSGVWKNYPGGVATEWPLAKVRKALRDSVAIGYFKPDAVLCGFFLVRQEAPRYVEGMPEDYSARDAWRLWLAGAQSGLTAGQLQTALDSLSKDGWFVHLAGHLVWTEAPRDAMSNRVRQYLDNRYARYDYDRAGHTISIWVHEA